MNRRRFLAGSAAGLAAIQEGFRKAWAGTRRIQERKDTVEELDTSDWESFLRTLFPSMITQPFADRHRRHWEWVWALRRGVRPRPYVQIWPRGGGKSSTAEMTCVVVGALEKRRYALYLSSTQEQADQHVANVAALLESEQIQRYYPNLGRPQIGLYGSSKGWRRNRLATASGFIIDALGLEADSVRGLKREEQRPDFEIPDDIDARHDSVDITAKKIQMLTQSVFPAGSSDCAILGVQNLVHKDSIFSLLQEGGGADFLLDRIVSGPYKAIDDWPDEPVEGVHYERRDIKYFILKGTPSWEGQNIATCQNQINTWGFGSFMREAQHVVDKPEPGAIFPAYDERYHVITRSELAAFFDSYDPDGNPMIPTRGNCTVEQDWGSTHEHPCITLMGWRPAEEMPLSDCFFIVGELGFPETIYTGNPDQKAEPVAPTPVGMAMVDMIRENHITFDRLKNSVMSHEASAACNTYRALSKVAVGYPNIPIGKWNAKAKGGVEEIQDYLFIRMKDIHGKPFRHPFRPQLIGCPRLFLVVEDNQVAKPGVDHKGLKRLRQEIPKYRNPTSPGGIEALKPKKQFDDAVDALRMMADVHFVRSQKRTKDQKIDAKMAPRFQKDAIAALPKEEQEEAIEQSYYSYHRAKHAVEKEERPKGTRQAIREKYKTSRLRRS